MTTVQFPKQAIQVLRRLQAHRRQPFYEVLLAGVARLAGPQSPHVLRELLAALGDEPP